MLTDHAGADLGVIGDLVRAQANGIASACQPLLPLGGRACGSGGAAERENKKKHAEEGFQKVGSRRRRALSRTRVWREWAAAASRGASDAAAAEAPVQAGWAAVRQAGLGGAQMAAPTMVDAAAAVEPAMLAETAAGADWNEQRARAGVDERGGDGRRAGERQGRGLGHADRKDGCGGEYRKS